MNNDQLPDSDQDLRLARALGRSADRSSVDAEFGEQKEFLEYLESARVARLSDDVDVPGEEMWEAVSRATRPTARIYQLGSWRMAASIAAAIVVVASILVIRVTSNRPALLLAANEGVAAVYTMDDGSTATLRPNSELYDTGRGTYRLVGEAYFSVAKQEDRSFVVETANAAVTVLGTRFVVATRSGGTSVFLEEGSVSLEALQSDERVTLSPGESRAVVESGISPAVTSASVEALDWLSGELVFRERTVAVVVEELAFHFGIALELPDTVATETISGRILLQSQDAALRDLAFILGGQFEAKPGAYELVPRAQ